MITIVIIFLLGVGVIFLLNKVSNQFQIKSPTKRFLILVATFLIGLLFITLIPSLILLKSCNIFSLYSTVENSLINTVGINQWLAKSILLIAYIPFGIIFKWLFSFSKTKRQAARTILILYTAGYYLAMYFLTQNIYFVHRTGEAIKYYVITPEGYRFFNSPGYDPKYGIKLEKVTPEIVRQYEMNRGVPISSVPINPDTTSIFFDRFTGDPCVWYSQSQNDSFEFFDHPGYHPKYGTPLKSITSEIIEQLEAHKTQIQVKKIHESEQKRFVARLQKYLNTSTKQLAGQKSILLLVFDEVSKGEKKQNKNYENKLKTILISRNLLITTELFRSDFFTEGYANALFDGQSKILSDLCINQYVDYLLLVQQETDFSQDKRLKGLISARINIDYQILKSTGQLVKAGNLRESGIGSSEKESIQNALSRIANRLILPLRLLQKSL